MVLEAPEVSASKKHRLEVCKVRGVGNQVHMVERSWLELAVENLMSKNEALRKQVEELSRRGNENQATARLAEAAVDKLEQECSELREERDNLNKEVSPSNSIVHRLDTSTGK